MMKRHLPSRLLILAVLFTLVLGVANAQDAENDAATYADSPAIVTTEGTPAALCEAAGMPAAPEVNSWTAPDTVIEDGVDYRAIFCTSAGPIYLDLYENVAPLTVNSLLFLAYNGYYNGTIFHRVIEDFMVQGGDPTGTGTGGPGYQFPDEFEPYLFFDRVGLLAMANAGAGTNGSQFFITTSLTPHLDYAHTIYGEVLEGYENVENIVIRDPSVGGDATTLNTVLIVKDAALVDTTYVEPEALSQEAIADALSSDSVLQAANALFGGSFPLNEVVVEETVLTPEDAIAAAPAAAKTALTAFLTDNNVEYVLESKMSVLNCALMLGQDASFAEIGYKLYAFESPEAAEAALDDANLPTLGIAGGLTDVAGLVYGEPLYVGEASACNQSATAGRVFFTRGNFVVEAESLMLATSMATHDLLIPGFSTIIFDRALSPVIRAGLRQAK